MPWGGFEGGCQKEAEGNLRDHEGQGPVLGLASRFPMEKRRAHRLCVSIAESRARSRIDA